jgi:hypothetical protein
LIGSVTHTSGNQRSRDFHAVYRGETFGNPGRGIVAALARGNRPGTIAADVAQLAVHGFAEGYFGAVATLGSGRAAGIALSSMNSWLFGQSRSDPNWAGMATSVSAVVFTGRRIGIVHVGDCRIYRRRKGQVMPLTADHVTIPPDGQPVLNRAVGGDSAVHIDYSEDAAEVDDRYIIVSQGVTAAMPGPVLTDSLADNLPPEAVAANIAEKIDGEASDGATILVIDVLGMPETSLNDVATALAGLPLRPSPREGDNWDGFVFGRTLYRSRYTVLKLARDTVEGRDVVLKIPLPSMLQDQVFHAGFLREAWVGATVRSPWVARYIDLPPERRSSLYLVMPYYRGETLEQRLLHAPKMSMVEGIGIALKLCAAVQDLASFQIIHRDLKPENVILLPNGEVRLLDLGLAYLPGIDDPDDDRLGGTTRYMPPELFKGAQASPRSEVFSLGVTIYRMFSGGKFPFGQRESIPLARLRPDLPSWLGRCLLRTIELDQDKRLADAGELAAMLEAGLVRGDLDADDLTTRPVSVGALRIWQGLTALFALAFVLLLAVMLWRR